jgi:hypothetical protein
MRWHFTSFSGKFRAAPMRAHALPGLLLLALVGAVLASACSNQGEGEFCTIANGNNDCQDGLECMAAPGVTASVNKNRCCPIPPGQPTTSACALNTSTVIDASTEIPDAIPGSTPDAEAGSSSEASAPASPDATVDAGTEMADVTTVPEATPDAGHADALPE